MKQQTKIIKHYLKKMGFDFIKVRSHNRDMEADIPNGIIYLDNKWLDMKNDDESEFLQYSYKLYKSLGYKIKISMRTFAIFHELGHILSKVQYKNYGVAHYHYTLQVDKILLKKLPNEARFMEYRKSVKLEKLADQYGYIAYLAKENLAIELDNEITKLVR
jgi:hypothetical protein